jgi:hypothetical protein
MVYVQSMPRYHEANVMRPNVEIREEGRFAWSLYVDGRRMVDRESFTVVDRIRECLENPGRHPNSEASEVAQSIRDWQARQ